MNMGDDDIRTLHDKLNTISREVTAISTNQASATKAIEKLQTGLEDMFRNGCGKASSHQDHETRIRANETRIITMESSQAAILSAIKQNGAEEKAWRGKRSREVAEEQSGVSFRGFKAWGPAALEFSKPVGVAIAIVLVIAAFAYFKTKVGI